MDTGADTERRRLLRQGALFLFLSVFMGIIIASPVPNPRKWLAVHLTGILTGLLLVAAGSVWRDLTLPAGQRIAAHRLLLVAAWAGLAFGVYAAVVDFPGPALDPGRQPGATWEYIPFVGFLLAIVPSTLAATFLMWKGLRD